MFVILQPIVLAAATTLPFTLPAGFLPLPTKTLATSVSSWVGPGTPASRSTLTLTTMAFPLTVDALGNNAKAVGKMLGTTVSVASIKKVTLCGNDARLVTTRLGSGEGAKVTVQERVVKGGFATLVSYTRPAGEPADTAIQKVLRTFCPGAHGTTPELDLPAGWSAHGPSGLHLVGVWMGGPGEVLILMKGNAAKSLDSLASTARQESEKSTPSQSVVHVFRHQRMMMCGNPGLIVGASVALKTFPLSSEMAVTQAGNTSYMLSYTRIGTTPADPQAERALTSLCAGNASAAATPAASPMP